MAKRILLSFLGTGLLGRNDKSYKDKKTDREYITANYELNNEVLPQEEKFITIALSKFRKYDGILLLGTMKSMWDEAYAAFCDKNGIQIDEVYRKTLVELSTSSNHKTPLSNAQFDEVSKAMGGISKAVPIYYGLNDEEQWKNFEIIEKSIDNISDHTKTIDLDITHAFRSLPLFAISVINFLSMSKGKSVRLGEIYYGNLEVKQETNEIAKIVTLKPVEGMYRWVEAASAFQNFGNGKLLQERLEREGFNLEANAVGNFSNQLQLNYADRIKKAVPELYKLKSDELPRAAQLTIKPVIDKFLKNFDTELPNHRFHLELARWYSENFNYGYAYINLAEAMVSFGGYQNGIDIQKGNNQQKEKNQKKAKDYWKDDPLYQYVNNIRNTVAHPSSNDTGIVEKAIRELISKIGQVENHFNKHEKQTN